MIKAYIGIDVGSVSTKGVVIDEGNAVIAEEYLLTGGDPIDAVKALVKSLYEQCGSAVEIAGAGTTGSARRLAGAMLNAGTVKNEITAHAVGTLSVYPGAATILEIGGQDSKIIILDGGVVVDYAMNTLCAAGTGAFLSSQAARLNVPVEDFGTFALKASRPAAIAARCTVFAESDLVHKMQVGYKKEDIIAGLCNAVVSNYLNNLAKGKKIKPPVIFQGGVSKNIGVVRAFERALNTPVTVDPRAPLMGAFGAAILSKSAKPGPVFNFNAVLTQNFQTEGAECAKCANNCELVNVFRNGAPIDVWGRRCAD